jgi:hypothetical protein
VFARCLLFPLVHPFYGSLTTVVTLTVAVMFIAFLVVTFRRENTLSLAAGTVAVLVCASYYFAKRPFLVEQVHNYESSAFIGSRYYFPLNLIALFLVFQAFDSVLRAARSRTQAVVARGIVCGFVVFSFSDVAQHSHFGEPCVYVSSLGTIEDCVRAALRERRDGSDAAWKDEVEIRTIPECFNRKVRLPLAVVSRFNVSARSLVVSEGPQASTRR